MLIIFKNTLRYKAKYNSVNEKYIRIKGKEDDINKRNEVLKNKEANLKDKNKKRRNMKVIDEVNEIFGEEFELIIGTIVQQVSDPRFGERQITLVDRKGILKPLTYNAKAETFEVDKWFLTLSVGIESDNWRSLDNYHSERRKLVLMLFNKVKRIRKINELLNED